MTVVTQVPNDPPKQPWRRPAQADPGDLLEHLAALTTALHDQTRAMRELAESNRAVVDYLLAQEDSEQDETPDTRYLDGTPR